jgi:hypothetical protein
MQFVDDWPGIFIRGDDAIGYAAILRRAVERLATTDLAVIDLAMTDLAITDDDLADLTRLAELIDLLCSCRVTHSRRQRH